MSPILPAQSDHPGDASEDEVVAADAPHPVVINGDSDSGSYSDDDGPSHEGYELLSQDPDSVSNHVESDNAEFSGIPSNGGAEVGEASGNSVIRSLFLEVVKVADEEGPKAGGDSLPCRSESKGYSMDEEHIEKIKAAMKGFTLPSCNVPAWASIVPEEEWKMQIFTFLESRGHKGNPPSSNTRNKSDLPCTSRELENNKSDEVTPD